MDEDDSVITATVNAGNGYTVGTSGSASVTVNDNDGTSPAQVLVTVGTPEDVAATAAGSSRIDLSWTAPEGEPTGYNVNWSPDGQPGTWRPVDPAHDGAETRYSHTGLTAETAYHYRVRAVNRRRARRMVGGGQRHDRTCTWCWRVRAPRRTSPRRRRAPRGSTCPGRRRKAR